MRGKRREKNGPVDTTFHAVRAREMGSKKRSHDCGSAVLFNFQKGLGHQPCINRLELLASVRCSIIEPKSVLATGCKVFQRIPARFIFSYGAVGLICFLANGQNAKDILHFKAVFIR